MYEALDGHEGSVSIGGRLITNLCFADDIVVNAEEKEEAGVLVDRLDTTTTRYKMEIGPDKTRVMTNNSIGFQRKIKMEGQRLEEVDRSKAVLLLWFLTVTCSCCAYLYFGSAIMLVTHFVNFR